MTNALRLELRRGRTLVAWTAVLSAAYAGFIAWFYPTVLDNAADFERMMALYPKELVAAFGIEGSLGDPGTFLNSYVFQFLWPLVAALAAIMLATRIAADADRGFLDLPLATPLSRTRLLLAAIGAQVLWLVVLGVVTVGAIEAVDLLIEPDFPTLGTWMAGLHAILLSLAIAGVASALAVITLRRGMAGGIAAGVLVLMYLFKVVAALAPDVADIGRISAFSYFDLRTVIDTEAYPVRESALFLTVAVAGWAIALAAFRRRDLAA